MPAKSLVFDFFRRADWTGGSRDYEARFSFEIRNAKSSQSLLTSAATIIEPPLPHPAADEDEIQHEHHRQQAGAPACFAAKVAVFHSKTQFRPVLTWVCLRLTGSG